MNTSSLNLGLVSADVQWAVSVSAHRASLPCRRPSDVGQLWVLPGVQQAGGRSLHGAAAL